MSNLPAGASEDPNAPWNLEEEKETCFYCGEPCKKGYCDDACKKADLND